MPSNWEMLRSLVRSLDDVHTSYPRLQVRQDEEPGEHLVVVKKWLKRSH